MQWHIHWKSSFHAINAIKSQRYDVFPSSADDWAMYMSTTTSALTFHTQPKIQLLLPFLITPQPHRTQTLTPHFLNMLNRLQKMRHKFRRILRRWKVSQIRHHLMLSSCNLICCLLAHLRCVGPIVFSCEHIDWACIGVDASDTRAPVRAA